MFAVQLLFAPASIKTTGFFIVGKVVAIAGRSIPGSLPSPNKLDAIAAPVEFQESGSQFPWLLVGYSTAVVLTAVGILLFYRVRKMKREDEEEDG